LFVCGDQLLRGAALNAVLIAEYMRDGSAAPPTVNPPKPGAIDTSLAVPVAAAALAGVAIGAMLFSKK
jgi:hypothetical protein